MSPTTTLFFRKFEMKKVFKLNKIKNRTGGSGTQRVALLPHSTPGSIMSSGFCLCRASPVLHIHVDFLNVLWKRYFLSMSSAHSVFILYLMTAWLFRQSREVCSTICATVQKRSLPVLSADGWKSRFV